MSHRGLRSWPPLWVGRNSSRRVRREGEIGILTEVKCHDLSSTNLFLFIQHDGEIYMGSLIIDDRAFRNQIHDTLEKCLGRSIQDIGSIDLDTA
jgi:hypothetical protein